jgi:hypothetical protein
MRSDQQNLGRYSYGGKSTVVGNNIGWWERTTFTTSTTDVPYVLEAKYHQRPDLLAASMYGKSTLMWFVLQYNNIVDVQEEFVTGASLQLPTKARTFSELLTKK